MKTYRSHALAVLLALTGIALGQQGAGSCPEFPDDARAYGGDAFTIGDWVLVAGAWMSTCADGHALWVACSDDGDGHAIVLAFPDLAAGAVTVSFGDRGALVVIVDPLAATDGYLHLRKQDVARLIDALGIGDRLRFTVAPNDAATAVRDVLFATRGFEEALPWLGCGDADACPFRSCGR